MENEEDVYAMYSTFIHLQTISRAHMRMNIQSLHTFGFILTFVLFSGFLVSFAVVGAIFGPTVLIENIAPDNDLSRDIWTGSVSNLTKLNQQLLLSAQIQNKRQDTGLTGDVTFIISLEVKSSRDLQWAVQEKDMERRHTIVCNAGEPLCNSVIIAHEPFLSFHSYRYNVTLAPATNSTAALFIGNCTFTFSHVNEVFTLFELWFRFAFLLSTIFVLCIFAHKLKSYSWADWTIEQKWTALLLFGLFAWNNPLFPLGILLNHWIPAFVDALMIVSFLNLILLYWLIMFDGIHRSSSERNWFFYTPKIVLLTCLWGVTIAVFTMLGVRELDDPSNTIDSLPHFLIIMLVLVIIYALYLVYAVCRAFGSMFHGGSRVAFFNLFTIVIFLLTIAGFLAGFLTPLVRSNAAEFLAFLALYNLYVFTLAFAYLPTSAPGFGAAALKYDDELIELEEHNVKLTSHVSDNEEDEFGINNLESDSDSDSL